MDKDAEITLLKALCKQRTRLKAIVEKHSSNLGDTLYILTAQRSARLNLLYRLCNLHVCIPEDTRIEIGDIIDDAYENRKKECDEGRKSDLSTDDCGD
jgi:hypothetical protein